MHIDRRKSAIDVFEHVAAGVRAYAGATGDDRPPRSRKKRKVLVA